MAQAQAHAWAQAHALALAQAQLQAEALASAQALSNPAHVGLRERTLAATFFRTASAMGLSVDVTVDLSLIHI